MKMRLYSLRLPLAHEFTISRESMTWQNSLIVALEHEGTVGYGEVTENQFYGHPLSSIIASLSKAEGLLDAYVAGDPLELWPDLMKAVEGDTFAASALDMAAHDWRGKHWRKPTWEVWGLHWENVPSSSYTIGIDSIENMKRKLEEKPDWPIYKIKLGTSNDLEIVRQLRACTHAKFRVDANCAWTAEQTIENSRVLAGLGVQFIEQPLPQGASEADKARVFKYSQLPIIADEDCQVSSDVQGCVGLYHGINVKICKCGGLTPALSMLREAKTLGLKTMVGCMVESSVGISGAAQLLPLLDYADLDGAVLLASEPAVGVVVDNGHVRLVDPPEKNAHGTGAGLNLALLDQFQSENE